MLPRPQMFVFVQCCILIDGFFLLAALKTVNFFLLTVPMLNLIAHATF